MSTERECACGATIRLIPLPVELEGQGVPELWVHGNGESHCYEDDPDCKAMPV